MYRKETINIDNKDHKISDLSKECQAEIQSLQFCEAELARLHAQIAVVTTARHAYSKAVAELIPKTQH
jgi:hypothetical protein